MTTLSQWLRLLIAVSLTLPGSRCFVAATPALLDEAKQANSAQTLLHGCGGGSSHHPCTTFVFLLGLEGTGHHFMGPVFGALAKRDPRIVNAAAMSDFILHLTPGVPKHRNPFKSPDEAEGHFRSQLDAYITKQTRPRQSLSGQNLTVILPAMPSYPNLRPYVPGNRAPVMKLLRLLYEAPLLLRTDDGSQSVHSGVRIRFLVLRRSLVESMLANCVHRHFSSCDEEARLLYTENAVLKMELEHISQESVARGRCRFNSSSDRPCDTDWRWFDYTRFLADGAGGSGGGKSSTYSPHITALSSFLGANPEDVSASYQTAFEEYNRSHHSPGTVAVKSTSEILKILKQTFEGTDMSTSLDPEHALVP